MCSGQLHTKCWHNKLLSLSLCWRSWQDLYPCYWSRWLSVLFSGFWNPRHLRSDTMVIYINDLHTKNNQSTGGQSHTQLLVLPEIFDGDRSFADWICHFKNVSAVNGWSDNDRILWLRVRLTGKAYMAYSWLSHEMQQSCITTKEVLSQRFELPSKRQLYKLKVEFISQFTEWSQRGISSKQILRPA